MSFDAVLDEALKLPERDRAKLAARLLESIDDEAEPDEDYEASWGEALDRRVQEIREGRAVTTDADEVFRKLREEMERSR